MLLCINTGAKRKDEKRFKFETNSLYFKTRAEMAHMFRDLEGSVRTTLDVADQVDVEIEFGKYHLPIFTPDTPETADTLFDRLLEEGLVRMYGATHDAVRRLESLDCFFLSYSELPHDDGELHRAAGCNERSA